MCTLIIITTILLCSLVNTSGLIPPRFQWRTLDFEWEGKTRDAAIASGSYIPENNMPTGLARWKDKLFITIPRWKKGVPSSLNYIHVDGSQNQSFIPYPSWQDAYITNSASKLNSNSTVVCTFRIHVDQCDRLWVVDNGVAEMSSAEVKQVADPAVLVFDLNTDKLLQRYELKHDVLKDSSVLTSIVVDLPAEECDNAYAYITDMGSNAILVYHMKSNDSWRVENHYFHFDPHAGVYTVGGVHFYWSDGVSSAALSRTKPDGHRDLYFHPTSSTKQFKMSTRLLRDKNIPKEEIFNGVSVIGDRGPNMQATACDYDPDTNVLFFTQLCKNGLGCWDSEQPFSAENAPLIISDCHLLEFPNDVKVDREGNLWVLSDRQSRFLYESMDFNQINFRVITAPIAKLIQGTPCEKKTAFAKAMAFIKGSGFSNYHFTNMASVNRTDK